MKKFYAMFLVSGIVVACAPLDKEKQLLEVSIPILKHGEPEKATSSNVPKGSKIFVVYAQENRSNNHVSVTSRVVVNNGSVYIGSSCQGCSKSHLTYQAFQGDVERKMIENGFKPTFANLINNDKLYMDSRIMLDRVASLGKSVNAPYTLLIRDAYIGYGNSIAYAKAAGCDSYARVYPLVANIDAILLNNSTGEVLTSFTYKMTNIEDSYNSNPATLYNYSKYKYYDYVERRGFNLPTTDWPSCRYGVKHSNAQYDNLCWSHTGNGCVIPDNTFRAYRSKIVTELIKSL